MADRVPKEIRIDKKRLNEIRELMVHYEETNESKFIRELIDIGYMVKKSQAEKSEDEEEENWENVYRDTAKKMQECHHLIKQIFSFTYQAKLSKYDGYGEEINVNIANTVANIEELLAADDYVFQKLKAVKGK